MRCIHCGININIIHQPNMQQRGLIAKLAIIITTYLFQTLNTTLAIALGAVTIR